MVIIIDNYDSFVHNLARYVKRLGFEVEIFRNDAVSLELISNKKPSHIILSPGPCAPDDAGICLGLVKYFYKKIPILGVCLGHQVIAQSFGAKIVRCQSPAHGEVGMVEHDGDGLFAGIPSPMEAGRYHSLVVDLECGNIENKDIFSKELGFIKMGNNSLEVIARLPSGIIMALKHKKYPVYGVQFHPESVLTRYGYELLNNFLI